MSFLKLNGWTIPVVRCKKSLERVGSEIKNLQGELLRTRRTTKEMHRFSTAPMLNREAAALIGLVESLGDGLHDSRSDLLTMKYGAPVADDAERFTGLPPDGTPYWYLGGTSALYFIRSINNPSRVYALAVEPSTSNILPADSRDAENAPTGYTAMGGALLSASTNYFWQGAKSLKITASSSGDGAYASANPGSGSNGKTYVGSVFLYLTTTASDYEVTLYDNTNAAGTTLSLTGIYTPQNRWVRWYIAHTISGGDSADLRLQVKTAGTGAAVLYADAWQIEEQPSNWPAYPTSWVDGDRADDGEYSLPPSILSDVEAMSACLFAVSPPWINPTVDSYLLNIEWAEGGYFRIYRPSGTGDLVFTVSDLYGDSVRTLTASGVYSGAIAAYQLITATMNPERGPEPTRTAGVASLYKNASQEDTNSLLMANASYNLIASPSKIQIGHRDGANYWLGFIGRSLFVPYEMPSEMIQAMQTILAKDVQLDGVTPTNQGYLDDTMRLVAEGDYLQNKTRMIVWGRVADSENMQGNSNSYWRSNLRTVEFELREV